MPNTDRRESPAKSLDVITIGRSSVDLYGQQIGGVEVAAVVNDPSPARMVFDPRHPLANGDGYVAMPNVNVVDETVNMIAASRSYQANVEVLNTAKALMMKTLTIGQ